MKLDAYLRRQRALVDRALDRLLPPARVRPARLHEAMRYAVLQGGKRIRPVLVLASCQAVGGRAEQAMPAACAVEFIHGYSLVHDDLPSMDDDATRRGQPTCHKKYGEATALLVGDALQTLAFETLAGAPCRSAAESRRRLEGARLLAAAAGSHGMVGGQCVDIETAGSGPDVPTLEYINTHKTGALIAVSTRLGGYLGGGSPRQVRDLYDYGKSLGLLFQIIDDIMDKEGYAKSIGIAEAEREARKLHDRAKSHLASFGKKGAILAQIADFILTRDR